MSDLGQARLKAEQGVKAKSRFLANMSFEIRAPLNDTLNMNDLPSETPFDQTQRDDAKTPSALVNKPQPIVNSPLEVSRVEVGCIATAPTEAAPVLLVEDVEVNRKVATAILTKVGYRVENAANGLEALNAVTAGAYGLILMDIAMPVMDGHEATRRIRALPGEAGRTPIVAMTAGTFDEDRQLCLASGMNDFISKPVVKAELLAAVRRWLLGHDEGMERARNVSAPHDGITETLLSEATLTELNDNLGVELVPRMIQGFLGEMERRIERLHDAIQAHLLVEASADAHSLKGSAGTFGAAALQEGARRLELACRAQDMTTVQILLPIVIATAQRTRLVMQSRYDLPESV